MSLINYKDVLIENLDSSIKNYEDSFTKYKRKVFCQLGEDGIIERIFDVIGTTNKYYVEFGGWDGIYLSNTANLRINRGWSGLLLEGDKNIVLSTINRVEINLHNEWITKDNINDIFTKYNVPQSFDFLSIDIDGDDYHIWKALTYNPRVVVVETNPGIKNDIPLTVIEGKANIYLPNSQTGNYFGANLHAFLDLASIKGYTFLTMDEYNAFFVLDSEFEKFGIEKKTKEEILRTAFVPCKYWGSRNEYRIPPYEWVNLTQTLI